MRIQSNITQCIFIQEEDVRTSVQRTICKIYADDAMGEINRWVNIQIWKECQETGTQLR